MQNNNPNPETVTMSPAPKKTFKQGVEKVFPAGHNRIKALLVAVLVLIAFLIGMLAGAYFPWYVSLVVAIGVVAGGYIAMAQIETRNIPDRLSKGGAGIEK